MPDARRTRRRPARARPGKHSPPWELLHGLHGKLALGTSHPRGLPSRPDFLYLVSTIGLGTHVSNHKDCVFPRLRYSWLGLGSATQLPFLATLRILCR